MRGEVEISGELLRDRTDSADWRFPYEGPKKHDLKLVPPNAAMLKKDGILCTNDRADQVRRDQVQRHPADNRFLLCAAWFSAKRHECRSFWMTVSQATHLQSRSEQIRKSLGGLHTRRPYRTRANMIPRGVGRYRGATRSP